MKFDLFNWQEVTNNAEINARKGILRVRCSQPAPLYVQAHGVEALAGYGTSFEVDLAEEASFRVEGLKGTRVFYWYPDATAVVAKGEVFTNIDRMPGESGTVLEVTRALRNLEIQRRSILRELREEAARLRPVQPAPEPDLPVTGEPVASPAPVGAEPEAGA